MQIQIQLDMLYINTAATPSPGPLVDHAGTFGLFLTSSTGIVHLQGTKPNVDVAEISSVEAKGPGCFNLYKYPNYRGHISSVFGVVVKLFCRYIGG